MSSGDDGEDHMGRRKRFDRSQVEALEAVFRACPHPDEKQRIALSRRLGLKPQQIKFWFQNKRTHIKTQNDKHANSSLRTENDNIRCETVGIQLALRNCACPKCGVQLLSEEEEQRLQLENECIKAEIDRCIGIINNQLGRSFAEISVMQSPLGHLSAAVRANRNCGPSLNVDVLSNNSSMNASLLPINTPISESDKALLIEQATNAMEELIVLVRTKDLWIKSMYEDKEILDIHNYRKLFRKTDHHFADTDIRVESSRASDVVCVSPLALVDMFMDPAKWTDLFPTIVSKAKIIEVLSVGMGGNNYSGSLVLMHSNIEILSPLILSREYYFIRYCQLVENGFWFITDVSVNLPGYPVKNRRLPSGCLIQEMPNGYSKVTWVELVEVEETSQNLGVFQNFVHSGTAFGAQRWLATLQRMTERFHYMLMPGPQNMDYGGVILTRESKISMMTLSHSMVKSFCGSLRPPDEIQQCTLWDANDIQIRVLPLNAAANAEPSGMILNAITSTWLPFSREHAFSFFKDESNRDRWDILSIGSKLQPITNIYSGLNVGNSISILRAMTQDQEAKLILQETCTDSSVSMLVYASVDEPTMEMVMRGGDTSSISINPSGVAILPNCNPSVSMGPSSSSNPTISGSFVTLSFQIVMNSLAASNLNMDSLASISSMISDTMQNLKTALNFS